jgi:cyclopropane-fatty-acyl-phospholipid synthase
MRIGIVGAGVSGLVVAHLLHREHEVIVFEAGEYARGHTNTIRSTPGMRRTTSTPDSSSSTTATTRTSSCQVTTTTISREQHDYVVERVAREGLEGRVTVLLDDYRDLRGSYDKLVSIETIEAVGWRQTGAFVAKCSELRADDAMMLLQAITIDDRAYEVEKASRSFIKTLIFPGGSLPSLELIARQLARRTDFQTVDLEDLTPHHVDTPRCWRHNLEAATASLSALGYDEHFRRLWYLYLSYCEAGFAERRICDIQMLLVKPRARIARRSQARGDALQALEAGLH